MKVNFHFDQKKLKQFVDDCSKSGTNALALLVEKVEGRAKKLAPRKTGHLHDSITHVIRKDKGIVKVTAVNKEGKHYPLFVHEGTGIYGKHAHPIVPVSARGLWWEGCTHPFHFVKGQKANPFLQNALEQIADENLN